MMPVGDVYEVSATGSTIDTVNFAIALSAREGSIDF